eukprot:4936337-Pleurochrysis_carterae.AAC.1
MASPATRIASSLLPLSPSSPLSAPLLSPLSTRGHCHQARVHCPRHRSFAHRVENTTHLHLPVGTTQRRRSLKHGRHHDTELGPAEMLKSARLA